MVGSPFDKEDAAWEEMSWDGGGEWVRAYRSPSEAPVGRVAVKRGLPAPKSDVEHTKSMIVEARTEPSMRER